MVLREINRRAELVFTTPHLEAWKPVLSPCLQNTESEKLAGATMMEAPGEGVAVGVAFSALLWKGKQKEELEGP
jgi:hypothetical protein